MYFVDHFNLVDGKEIRPLYQLVNEIAPNLPRTPLLCPLSLLVTKAMNVIEESKHESRKAQQLAYQQQLTPGNRQLHSGRLPISLHQRPGAYWTPDRSSTEFRSSLCYNESGEEPSVTDETAAEAVPHSPARYPALVLRSVPPEVVNRSSQSGSVPAGVPAQAESQAKPPSAALSASTQSAQSVQSMQSKTSISPVSPAPSPAMASRPVSLGQPMRALPPAQQGAQGAQRVQMVPRAAGQQPIYQYMQQQGQQPIQSSPQQYGQ